MVESSSDAVFRTVSFLHGLGYLPLPIHARSRCPVPRGFMREGYVSHSKDWLKGDYGVSLLLRSCDRLVDIDIDDARLTGVAVAYLPHTDWIIGRKSKKSGHHVFVIGDSEESSDSTPNGDSLGKGVLTSECIASRPKNSQNKNVDLNSLNSFSTSEKGKHSSSSELRDAVCDRSTEMLIEYRGPGHQVVMPGSVHMDTGEFVEWIGGREPSGGPSVVSGSDLRFAFRRVGFTALVADNGWHDGVRHHVALSLSGMMRRSRWSLDDAEKFFRELIRMTGEGDSRDVMRCVRDTYGVKGGNFSGGSRLSEVLGDDWLTGQFRRMFMDPLESSFDGYDSLYSVGVYFSSLRVFDHRLIDDVSRVPDFETLSPPDFHLLNSNDRVFVSDPSGKSKGSWFARSKLWFDHPRRRTYRSTDFCPGMPGEIDGRLNLWRGWGVEPCGTGSISSWLGHLEEYVCSGDASLFGWVLDWLADIVQCPMSKPGTAFVMIGGQRTGKNTFVEMLKRMIGIRYCRELSNNGQIANRFNSHFQYSLLVFANEADLSNSDIASGVLKPLFTDHDFHMDHKHGHAKMGRNYTRVVLASNKSHVLRMDRDDKRYTVTELSNIYDDMEFSEVRSHFDSVYGEIEGDGPSRLLDFLQRRKYDRDFIRVSYRNAAGRRQIVMSMEPVASWWRDCLLAGFVPVPDDFRHQIQHRDGSGYQTWPLSIGRAALRASFLSFSRVNRDIRSQDFFGVFDDESGLGDCSVRHLGGRRCRYRAMVLPDLDTCVRRFEFLHPGVIDGFGSDLQDGADMVDDGGS